MTANSSIPDVSPSLLTLSYRSIFWYYFQAIFYHLHLCLLSFILICVLYQIINKHSSSELRVIRTTEETGKIEHFIEFKVKILQVKILTFCWADYIILVAPITRISVWVQQVGFFVKHMKFYLTL